VGHHVFSSASSLVGMSKKNVIGNGSAEGFVRAVLEQVPSALVPQEPSNPNEEVIYGPVIYAQLGSQVQKRASDIGPGDILTLRDATFKTHKGLSSITHKSSSGSNGRVDNVVGVIHEMDGKRGKVKIWRAVLSANTYPVSALSRLFVDVDRGIKRIYCS
jgi:hypothetical protein